MIGIYYGRAHHLYRNSISMRTYTNIKRWIILSMRWSLQGKTDCAIILERCNRSLAEITLTFYLRLTFFQRSLQNSRSHFNRNRLDNGTMIEKEMRKVIGSLNLNQVVKVKGSLWSMAYQKFHKMKAWLFHSTSTTLCLLTDLNLIWDSMFSLLTLILLKFMFIMRGWLDSQVNLTI